MCSEAILLMAASGSRPVACSSRRNVLVRICDSIQRARIYRIVSRTSPRTSALAIAGDAALACDQISICPLARSCADTVPSSALSKSGKPSSQLPPFKSAVSRPAWCKWPTTITLLPAHLKTHPSLTPCASASLSSPSWLLCRPPWQVSPSPRALLSAAFSCHLSDASSDGNRTDTTFLYHSHPCYFQRSDRSTRRQPRSASCPARSAAGAGLTSSDVTFNYLMCT